MSSKPVRALLEIMNIFTYELVNDGLICDSTNRNANVLDERADSKVKDWSSFGNRDVFRGLAAIGPSIQEVENLDTDEILISHDQIATLSEADAQALNLPVSVLTNSEFGEQAAGTIIHMI